MEFFSRCLSANCLLLLVMIIGVFTPRCLSITTTFHDKPDETKLPVMAKLMRQEEDITTQLPLTSVDKNSTTLQITTTNLSSSERQKRLLPYTTFYLAHDFNLPSSNLQTNPQVYQTPQGTRYQLVEQTKPATTYQQFHNKFTELTSNQQPQQVLYQPKIKFTPFLENNALPGPFHPMRQPQPQKTPNFSQIYDKLSQLKLLQQQQPQPSKGYTRYQPFHYQQQKYIPLVEYQGQSPIDQDKTIIHTYSSTNIDVPAGQQDKPLPESHHQQQFISSPPHQDHVQPVTEEEHQQYLEDTQKYVQQEVRRPQIIQVPKQQVLILRQKPIRVIPHHKYIYEDGKATYQQQEVPQKQLVYVRKPQIAVKPQVIQIVIPQQSNKYHQQQQEPTYELPSPGKPHSYENVRYETIKYVNNKPQQEQPSYEQVVYPEYQVPKYSPQPYNPPAIKYQHIPYSTHKPKSQQLSTTAPLITYEKVVPRPSTQPGREYHQHHSSPTAVGVTTNTPYLPTENSNSLSLILKKLQDTNALPHTLTPDNIDNSIKTLVKILSSLKKQQHFARPIVVADENPTSSQEQSTTYSQEHEHNIQDNEAGVDLGGDTGGPDVVSQSYPLDTQEGGTPGKPGVDYPALATIPKTSFNCKTQRYKGFFGDPDTNCQVWHYCDLNGGQASFLCPNGTIFSQVALTCDWWYNVKCSTTAQLYVLNERLYKYILPLSPKFPEDYSGPLVDRYLALKFKEMEDKMKKERKQNDKEEEDKQEDVAEDSEDAEDNETGKDEEENESTSKLSNEPMEAINVEDKSTESNSEISEKEQIEEQ